MALFFPLRSWHYSSVQHFYLYTSFQWDIDCTYLCSGQACSMHNFWFHSIFPDQCHGPEQEPAVHSQLFWLSSSSIWVGRNPVQARPPQSFSLYALRLTLQLPCCDTFLLHMWSSHPCKAGSLATLYPIDHCPIDHSPPATAERCYHSQLSSDSQHPFYQTSQAPSTGTKSSLGPPTAAQWLSEGTSQQCCFVSSSPPAFWPFQTHTAGYLHPAVCISRAQVFTSPCWFP